MIKQNLDATTQTWRKPDMPRAFTLKFNQSKLRSANPVKRQEYQESPDLMSKLRGLPSSDSSDRASGVGDISVPVWPADTSGTTPLPVTVVHLEHRTVQNERLEPFHDCSCALVEAGKPLEQVYYKNDVKSIYKGLEQR